MAKCNGSLYLDNKTYYLCCTTLNKSVMLLHSKRRTVETGCSDRSDEMTPCSSSTSFCSPSACKTKLPAVLMDVTPRKPTSPIS